jgi:hypothetical protein
MICMEMSGNGVRIGMEVMIQGSRLIRQGRVPARRVFFAAGPGTALQGTVVLQIAAGTRRTARSTSSDFVLSPWTFSHLLFALLPFAKGCRGVAPARYKNSIVDNRK